MLQIGRFFDLVINYNLILPVTHMQKDTVLIAALCFPYEKFAILNGSEEDFDSVWSMIESLKKERKYDKGSGCGLIIAVADISS